MHKPSIILVNERFFSLHKKIAPMYFNFIQFMNENPTFEFLHLFKYSYKVKEHYSWTNFPEGDMIPFGIDKDKFFDEKMYKLLYLRRDNYSQEYRFYAENIYKEGAGNVNLLNACTFEKQEKVDLSTIVLDKLNYFID